MECSAECTHGGIDWKAGNLPNADEVKSRNKGVLKSLRETPMNRAAQVSTSPRRSEHARAQHSITPSRMTESDFEMVLLGQHRLML